MNLYHLERSVGYRLTRMLDWLTVIIRRCRYSMLGVGGKMELTEEQLNPVLSPRPMKTKDLLRELEGASTPNPVTLETRVCTDPCFPSEGRRKHRHVVGLPGLRMARF